MVTLEHLVIGEAGKFCFLIDESFMQRNIHRPEQIVAAVFISREIVHDLVQAIQLPGIIGEKKIFKSCLFLFLQCIDQQVEIFIEGRLWCEGKRKFMLRGKTGSSPEFDRSEE